MGDSGFGSFCSLLGVSAFSCLFSSFTFSFDSSFGSSFILFSSNFAGAEVVVAEKGLVVAALKTGGLKTGSAAGAKVVFFVSSYFYLASSDSASEFGSDFYSDFIRFSSVVTERFDLLDLTEP